MKNCFKNMNVFNKIKLISALIHFKYWYYNAPSLELPCLPRYLCQFSPWPTETPLQYNPHHVLYRFPYFVWLHSTTHHNYWMYQTIYKATQANQTHYQAIYTSSYLIGQILYLSKSWVFKSRFFFKVRQDGK